MLIKLHYVQNLPAPVVLWIELDQATECLLACLGGGLGMALNLILRGAYQVLKTALEERGATGQGDLFGGVKHGW